MKLIERILDRYYCEKIFNVIREMPCFVDFKRIYVEGFMIVLYKKPDQKRRCYKRVATVSKRKAFEIFVYQIDDLYKNVRDAIEEA